MRHRWRLMAGIVVVGIVLGLAIGGLPNHRSDPVLRVQQTTTASTGPTATSIP